MNSRTFIKELKEYGPGLVMKHTVSKIKGTEDAEHDYIISLHNPHELFGMAEQLNQD